MAEEYSLADLVKEAITQESSRANADAMRARPTNTMNRVVEEENTIHTQLQELKNEMKVMCIRQSGKYSRKYKPTDISPQTKPCQKWNLATMRLDIMRNLIQYENLACMCLILFLCIKNLNRYRGVYSSNVLKTFPPPPPPPPFSV